MATTVEAAFETLTSRLTPSSTETTAAASHRQSVSDKLKLPVEKYGADKVQYQQRWPSFLFRFERFLFHT